MTFPHQLVRRWSRVPISEAETALETAGFPPWLAVLLARRGVADAAAAEAFLNPSSEHLHSPAELQGVEEAVERIAAARQRDERIAIVGDYDVDGISAAALLSAVLRAVGLEVEVILPNRLEEGYGFQVLHVDRAREAGCSLILTADCGTTAAEAVEEACNKGLDVIITDHHLPAAEPLRGAIEINPKRQPTTYPFPDLAGAGVALKLAVAVAEHFQRSIEVGTLLRVACLGTICDLVPLIGENRTIASLGLDELARTRSVGLQELMRKSDVQTPVTASDVGYRLGPRLNAAGRMSRPDEALELLMTRDRVRAAVLAQQLDDWNRSRQEAETRVVEAAIEAFAARDPLPPVLVAWSESWHPGVVGIAAGRIARKVHRPTVLFSVDGDWATGSGRSIAEIHLHEFLSGWKEEYERFGGHAEAIGMKVAVQDLGRLRETWEQGAAALWDQDSLTKTLTYELEIPASELDNELVAKLRTLEPFGMGNPQPVLRVGPLRPSGKPRFFGKGHLGLAAQGEDGSPIDLLGWGWQDRAKELEDSFEVLGCLEQDRYTQRPVLRLVDARAWELSSGSSAQEGPVPRRMTEDG
ncbi:MAG: single-stranded-DNA-specific exonuclease RecJ [Thermoanaerobaculia bacterium]